MNQQITDETIKEILHEHTKAVNRYASFNSAHEGYAILKEEVDELWDEIKKKDHIRDKKEMKKEAIQVAAMALRFITEICN